MTTELTARGWNHLASTPLGQEFATQLAGNRRTNRDPNVRSYVQNVAIVVHQGSVRAEVHIDDFGSPRINAAAAAAILGDVRRASKVAATIEVTVINSELRMGVFAALSAHFQQLGGSTAEAVLDGEQATRFVVGRFQS